MDDFSLPKTYDPHPIEQKWYTLWENEGFFHADEQFPSEPYSIVIPPPNVTGSLHMGHALNNTLQDILVRFHRMEGKNTLWLPGTDHAGIATQYVVEKGLAKEKKTRESLGREKFIERVWQWKKEHGGIIVEQLKRLGASCDWARERFTMDEGLSQAVREVFVRLYEEGLIYRGDYIINWCPRCHTALSDLEVEYKETQGKFYFIHYPLKKGGETLIVATTRPETMLGDTAIAVNPDDERYRKLIGTEALLPLMDRVIPVIGDEYVDKSFGTGALKITPAHDPNDFEVSSRHKLPIIKVMDESGRMNKNAGPYEGLDRFACREKVLEDLNAQKLLKKVEAYVHNIGYCYRCNEAIEPFLSKQWFVKTTPLAKPAIAAVREGKTRIMPSGWEKTYFEWMENIRDWCISRQIWWGHRIPAWYCGDCGEVTVSASEPQACKNCGSKDLTQEEDVLDTWFSSALWPFSTLGWPTKTKDLQTFYPTSVLVTGFDILFFWVARMMMMGIKFMGEVPFRDVYIHALVRDAKGQKMSKSLGNVIDPLVMIEKYGTDAFRFTLAALAAQGRDIRLAEDIIEGYRHFANKIWNVARFVLLNLKNYSPDENLAAYYSLTDKWILSRASQLIQNVRNALEEYRFNESAGFLYQFVWHEFCDWYVEFSKQELSNSNAESLSRKATQQVLLEILNIILKLLHPFMPFLTEEIWQKLPGNKGSIMISPLPRKNDSLINLPAEEALEIIKEVVYHIRNIRGEMHIPPSQKIEAIIFCEDDKTKRLLENYQYYLISLAHLNNLTFSTSRQKPHAAATAIVKGVEIFIPLEGLIDFGEEEKRLKKEIAKIEKEMTFVRKKLTNEDFLSKAPREVVDKEKETHQVLLKKKKKLDESIARLQEMRNAG
ncbi:MAG: valine--tRNA ligase [Thermodesulfobacteriota bacterium]|jgi:valyl-tRNA synthetase|nr:MAG: valine--tRNA ligase [Thermodesulfobacteriota bacterium]